MPMMGNVTAIGIGLERQGENLGQRWETSCATLP